uniref:Integrin, alpha E, tandem duplicate 1 n=1 Tax=Cyprinus carpio carpio TaxID=630221 RepID=A0A8C1EW06_CYPCA
MYRGLLFTIVIYSVTGFNIKKSPVKNFTNGDPLFGQTIIQSTDGVFVPSPKLGKLFRCTLENECVEVNSDDKKPKGLRPVASVSSLTSGEEQHVMMCNQIRVKQSATEDLNGDCKLVDSTGKFIKKFNPVALVNNNNNNNNNNNHYQARWIGQDQRRMRRDAQSHSDTKDKDKDYDDAGTEIAFVLDGSGSITPDNFQRAKDFIYNVMSNVWKTCFNCDFAIVQYGLEIRTELSLLDSKNHARALLKVKEIQQLGKLTMTASAIHHVLTDIFIPEDGSKNNSRKIIIVLSDGKILGDPMKLTDVLNMPQMKGVTRYSIGVGEGILSEPEAIQEMTQIADPEKFFKVSNYAALDDIQSSLEQSLIGAKVNVPLPTRSSRFLSAVTNEIDNEKLNSNNNNNHYRGEGIDEVKQRMRRDTQLDGDTNADEEEEEDDPGTEIAFVLDGSGSITPDDFQRAKDFMHNVMSDVWNTCFDCDFAIVQYGQEIKTELSLLENKDSASALLKVKKIQQLGKLTMTASAIHHVLTDIFIPENGSKNNSRKIIIVLSDGKILGDPMKLTDVLNMPQMKGVTRYSIGVGEGILNDTQAIKEMTQIADPDKFYKVSNYAALNDILSSLQQNLTGIEDSQQGGGFQFQL